MTDTQNGKKKVLSLSKKGTLGLKKPVDIAGTTRETKTHKTVMVEVKKKRGVPQQPEQAPEAQNADTAPEVKKVAEKPATPPKKVKEEASQNKSVSFRDMTEEQRAQRLKTLQGSLREEDQQRRAVLEEERKNHEQAERLAAEKEAAAQAEKEAAEKAKKAEEEKAQAVEKAKKVEKPAPTAATPASKTAETTQRDDRAPKPQRKPVKMTDEEESPQRHNKKAPSRRVELSTRWDQGKKRNLTRNFGSDDDQVRTRSLAAQKRAREKEKKKLFGEQQEQKKVVREVILPEVITVQELANRMAERSSNLIRELMKMGVMATINQSIDADTAELVIAELGHKAKRVSESDIETDIEIAEDQEDTLISRAPVVTVMGHVDHGKTSLLDALRATDVVQGEAGGITQHIGAYSVTLENGKKISFIDTPGHAAFSEMRSRGANITDIVILVVAADDGVKQQTIEAINHAQAANVPIIVAVNKIDVPNADPNRVGTELMQHNIYLEALGGEVLSVEVSAKKRLNLDKLEEAILLQAEMLDLKANPDRRAQGAVIEAKQEKGRGSVATILIQKGTLKVGDPFVAGASWGRVRALLDDKGRKLTSAGPSVPVEVLGLDSTPVAGDDFLVVENEAKARDVADFRLRKKREKEALASGRGTLEQMFSEIAAGERKDLPIIIKSDVHGSLEAILSSLEKLATDEVKARVLHAAVGGITESDIALAKTSNAIVIGFNVRANPQAKEAARKDSIDIRYYSIIYNVIDDIKAIMSGLLAPTLKEKFLGYAEIRQVFNISKVGKIGGCYVTEGIVKRGAKVRLLRDDVVIHEGALKTLKRFKDEVKEVKDGFECGMAFENYNDIQEKDVIECFEIEEIARTL